MFKRKKVKCLMFVGLVLALVVSLAAGACAPAAPTGEGDCSDVEAKLKSEKAKVSGLEDEVADLEKEIAALKGPAEVYEGMLTSLSAVHMPLVQEIADDIRNVTDGRVDLMVVQEESVGRLEDGMVNLGEGLMQLAFTTATYAQGLHPALVVATSADYFACRDYEELLMAQYDYGVKDIYQREIFDKLNVTELGYVGFTCENLVSNMPLTCTADLKDVKFRSSGPFAAALEAFGAKTVWAPGDEIYSMLASGVVDAVSYYNPDCMYSMGLNEVTKYWTAPPLHNPYAVNPIFANLDWWNKLPDSCQAAIQLATDDASYRYYAYTVKMDQVALDKCIAEGIQLTSWTPEEMNKWSNMWIKVNVLELTKTEPVIAEAWEALKVYLKDIGRPFTE